MSVPINEAALKSALTACGVAFGPSTLEFLRSASGDLASAAYELGFSDQAAQRIEDTYNHLTSRMPDGQRCPDCWHEDCGC